MSIDNTLFQLRRADERLWPTISNSSIISDVFESGCLRVACCHGHLAAVCPVRAPSSSRALYGLMSFDASSVAAATPTASLFGDTAAAAEFRAFLTTDQADSGGAPRGLPGPPCVSLFAEAPAHILYLPGDAVLKTPLRLVYVDQKGAATGFVWDPRTEKWLRAGTAVGFMRDPLDVQAVGFDEAAQSLVWADDGTVSRKRLVFPSITEISFVMPKNQDFFKVLKKQTYKPTNPQTENSFFLISQC